MTATLDRPTKPRPARQRLSAERASDLVGAARQGDLHAWNGFVHEFGNVIWAIARAHRLRDSDAANVSQATLLLPFEHLDRLNHPTRVSGTRSGALTVVTRAARLVQGQLTGPRALDHTPTR
jgi:hypothetical protein